MKVSIFVRSSYFSLASCALSVVPIAASAGTMPPRTIARPASAPFARSRSGAHVRRHLLYCSPAANGFVSVSSSGNIAGANFSGDAAGQSNQNCGSLSIIGGGETNLIYNDVSQSLAGESMVGAGNDNSVSNAESFVGAGSYNDVTADQAFIGAAATIKLEHWRHLSARVTITKRKVRVRSSAAVTATTPTERVR